MDEKNNLIDRQTMGINQTKYSMQEILLLAFLGIAEFLALAEWVAAFIRNSHILGFWFGAVLFLLTATTLVLMILWVKNKVFEEKKKKIGAKFIKINYSISFWVFKNYFKAGTHIIYWSKLVEMKKIKVFVLQIVKWAFCPLGMTFLRTKHHQPWQLLK